MALLRTEQRLDPPVPDDPVRRVDAEPGEINFLGDKLQLFPLTFRPSVGVFA